MLNTIKIITLALFFAFGCYLSVVCMEKDKRLGKFRFPLYMVLAAAFGSGLLYLYFNYAC